MRFFFFFLSFLQGVIAEIEIFCNLQSSETRSITNTNTSDTREAPAAGLELYIISSLHAPHYSIRAPEGATPGMIERKVFSCLGKADVSSFPSILAGLQL